MNFEYEYIFYFYRISFIYLKFHFNLVKNIILKFMIEKLFKVLFSELIIVLTFETDLKFTIN